MYYGTPPIVTNGLVLNLDAANSLSIPVDPTVNQATSPLVFTSNYSLTVTASNNTTLNYDNTLTAGTISGNVGYFARTSGYSPSLAYSKRYATSWLLKYSNLTSVPLLWGGAHTGNRTNFTFNLQTGAISSLSLAAGENYGSYNLGNGWYQVWYTSTTTGSGNNYYYPQISIENSGSVFIGGIQIEMNNYATPFTTTSRTSWFDLSGLNNTATLSSASITSSIPSYRSLNQRILNFDGTGSFVNTNLDLGWGTGSSVTLEMWIKAAGTSSAAFLGTPAFEWQLKQGAGASSTKNNNLVYVYWDTTGNHTNGPIITVVNYFDNNWKHLVLTWDSGSSTTSIYRNGELMTAQISGNPAANRVATQTTRIGGSIYNWGAVDPYWSGSIQNFRVYNRALSQQEVTQNYNSLKSRFGLQ